MFQEFLKEVNHLDRDRWARVYNYWVRVHCRPRADLYMLGINEKSEEGQPHPEELLPWRHTFAGISAKEVEYYYTDRWQPRRPHAKPPGGRWLGFTAFESQARDDNGCRRKSSSAYITSSSGTNQPDTGTRTNRKSEFRTASNNTPKPTWLDQSGTASRMMARFRRPSIVSAISPAAVAAAAFPITPSSSSISSKQQQRKFQSRPWPSGPSCPRTRQRAMRFLAVCFIKWSSISEKAGVHAHAKENPAEDP